MKSSHMRELLSTLSKPYSFEIITYCYSWPRNLNELSKYLEAPYMTVKDRVESLVKSDVLEVSDRVNPETNRLCTVYKTRNFSYTIDPEKIINLIKTA